MQLSSLAITDRVVNSTIPPFQPSLFEPSLSSVRINTLWSLSLTLSLITASLCILVKQWLHEFLARTTQDPKEQVKLRVFRDEGMKGWLVFEFAAFLPLFLQLALLLFFIGFSEFLRELNLIVGWVTTGAILSWLIVFIFLSFIAPMFSSQCPYKAPFLKDMLFRIRISFLQLLRSLLDTTLPSRHGPFLSNICTLLDRPLSSADDWLRRARDLEEDRVIVGSSDLAIALYTSSALRGERLHETFLQCFHHYSEFEVQECVRHVAPHIENLLFPSSSPSITYRTPLDFA